MIQDESAIPSVFPSGDRSHPATDGSSSGVSWAAVLAGAATSASLSLVLFILGVGLGLSAVSPWSYNTATIGKSTIIWLGLSQLASSGIGGYLAGRLRVKWASVHTDEVYFRDTAHGLLTWAVATLVTAIFLAGAVHAVIGGAIEVGVAASTAISDKPESGPHGLVGYFSEVLLRTDQTRTIPDNVATRGEVEQILVNDLRIGTLPTDDRQYLSSLVVKRTGLTLTEAEKRVDIVYARLSKAKSDIEIAAKETADKARKAAAYSALWMFVALMLGAFFASVFATLGGKQRDRVQSAQEQ